MFQNLFGNAEVRTDSKVLLPYLSTGEEIFTILKVFRDEVCFTNKGVYIIDVQGVSGRKRQIKFIPKKHVETVTFETAGPIDMDTEVELTIRGEDPLKIKVTRTQEDVVSNLIVFIKENYLG